MGSAKTAMNSIEVFPNRDSDTSTSLYKGSGPSSVMRVVSCLYGERGNVEFFATFGLHHHSMHTYLDAPSLIPMCDFIEGKPLMRAKLLVLAIIGTEVFICPLIGPWLCFVLGPLGKILWGLILGT